MSRIVIVAEDGVAKVSAKWVDPQGIPHRIKFTTDIAQLVLQGVKDKNKNILTKDDLTEVFISRENAQKKHSLAMTAPAGKPEMVVLPSTTNGTTYIVGGKIDG